MTLKARSYGYYAGYKHGENFMTNIVILGAGKPHDTAESASLILLNNDVTILDYIINVFERMEDARFQFVGGYHFDRILSAYPSLPFVLNNEWQVSGSLKSFMLADLDVNSDCFVTYSDVIYTRHLVTAMNETTADVVVASDSDWKSRFGERPYSDLKNAERIIQRNGAFNEITVGGDSAQGVGEFCGVAKLSSRALAFLDENKEFLLKDHSKSPLFYAINFLSVNGFKVELVEARGQWAELNQPADLGQFILGTKAETLDRLRSLIKRGLVGDCFYFKYSEWLQNSSAIIQKIQEFSKDQHIIVRSSAKSEDQAGQSNAGKFDSVLDVNPRYKKGLKKVITDVFDSYIDAQLEDQILIQRMVKGVKLSGVVMTRTLDFGAPYFVINYDISSSTDAVTSGRKADLQTVIIARNADVNESHCDPFVRDLLAVVFDIESILSDDSLDIEFAVTEDGKVHVFQVRPIVAKAGFRLANDFKIFSLIKSLKDQFDKIQNCPPHLLGSRTALGRMPDWNPAEIIGTRPNQLSRSLYEFLILDDVWAQQRSEYGYRDVRPTNLLRNFFGNVFIDVRASFNSFIPKNIDDELACKMIEFYLDRLEAQPESHDKVEFDILYTSYDFDLLDRMQLMAHEAQFSTSEIAEIYNELVDITVSQFPLSAKHLETVRLIDSKTTEIVESDITAIDKLKLLLYQTKKLGTLPFAHLARNGFVATSLIRSMVKKSIITAEDMARFYKSLSTVTYQMEVHNYLLSKGEMTKDEYLAAYGHLRPGTYEITVPTYYDNFAGYFSDIDKGIVKKKPDNLVDQCWTLENINAISKALVNSPLPWTFSEFDVFLRDAIAGREYAKLMFSKGLSASLDIIASFCKELGFNESEVTHLNIHDILTSASDLATEECVSRFQNIIAAEKNNAETAKLLEFPSLIFSSDEIGCHLRGQDEPNFVTSANVSAETVIINKLKTDADNLCGSIVLIEQADPGYDWLFSKGIAGLITMYGGSNSHMTIRCSELGIPAAIGVGDVLFRKFSVAKCILLDCGNQKIEVLN